MKLNLMALSVAVAALFIATSAKAQSNCADRAMVVERLGTKYGETRQSVGVAANNSVVETYANDGTGSWSIVVTMPNGQSCLVASGMSYEALANAAPTPGNDA
ncbi:hypothetical protein [Shimia ponticola]|uniref:hypothetical protein n=1 Tax=Shimia ponticola TaxID=2582893 RepID=UPI0011BE9BED|nr:hypothetical protein [Shimia ponticola]